MAGTLYDYMTALIIVGALFVGAVIVIPNVSYLNLLYVDQQQLRNVALRVLKTMLLDTGYPSNWGSGGDFNPDAVERFGLALSDSSSFHVLDPDKVERLVVDNPLGYLEYERVRDLLELQGYGFSMRVLPPFNVALENLTEGRSLKFNVATTTSSDQKPIPNAVVRAFIVYPYYVGKSGDTEKYSLQYVQIMNTTDELGKGVIEYTIPDSIDTKKMSHRMAVFQTTVADVATVTTAFLDPIPNDIAEVNMVNDELVITQPDSTPKDARWILNVAVLTGDGLMTFYNGTQDDKLNWGEMDRWSKNFSGLKSMEPVFLIGNIYAVEKGEGRKGLLVVGPHPNYLGSRVTEFGDAFDSGAQGSSVKLQRAVNISGMTYIVELMLWKEIQ